MIILCNAQKDKGTPPGRKKMTLEKTIQDILNAGIGLFKASEENFTQALGQVEKIFEELRDKGASDQSESAVKIREVLENTIKGVKELSGQAEVNFNRVLEEAQKNYAQVLEQIQQVAADERIKDLNSKIEELSGYIKTQFDGASEQVKTAAEQATAAATTAANQATETVKTAAGQATETVKTAAKKVTSKKAADA